MAHPHFASANLPRYEWDRLAAGLDVDAQVFFGYSPVKLAMHARDQFTVADSGCLDWVPRQTDLSFDVAPDFQEIRRCRIAC